MHHKWFSRRTPGKKSISWTHLRTPPATKHTSRWQSTLSDTWWTCWSWAKKYLEWKYLEWSCNAEDDIKEANGMEVNAAIVSYYLHGSQVRVAELLVGLLWWFAFFTIEIFLFDPDWLAKFVICDLPGTESSKAFTSLPYLELGFSCFYPIISSHFAHTWWLMAWTVYAANQGKVVR